MTDVAEVRSGSHSIGFVRTSSTDKGAESFSIVSSGTPMDLQVSSMATRDMLVDKLRVFVRKHKMAKLSDPTLGQGHGQQRQGQHGQGQQGQQRHGTAGGGDGGFGGLSLSSLERAAAGAIASMTSAGMAGGGTARPGGVGGGREATSGGLRRA